MRGAKYEKASYHDGVVLRLQDLFLFVIFLISSPLTAYLTVSVSERIQGDWLGGMWTLHSIEGFLALRTHETRSAKHGIPQLIQ